MRSFRAVVAGCGLTAIAGAGIALRGVLTPIYSVDFRDAGKLYLQWCDADARIDPAVGARYQALFTDHYPWKDAGIGLMLGAAMAAMIAVVMRRGAARGESWLRTPSGRWLFPLLGLLVIGLTETVAVNGFMTDAYRRYLPVCADSWGIPVTISIDATLIVAPILLLLGTSIALMFGKLPVTLWHWDRGRPVRSWIVTLIFAALMLLVSAAGILSLPTDTSGVSAPVVLAVYLLAATRAALLAPRRAGNDVTLAPAHHASLSMPSSPSLR